MSHDSACWSPYLAELKYFSDIVGHLTTATTAAQSAVELVVVVVVVVVIIFQ